MRIKAGWTALAGAAALVLTGPASAQEGAPAKPHVDPRPGYAALAKLPDWSGVWSPDWSALFGNRATPPQKPQYTARAAKELAAYEAGQKRGENLQTEVVNCIPPGLPGIMRQPYPIEFVFSPSTVYIIAETYSQVRRVYTDGRPLPEDPDLWFNGHSVGHWEGDTLVVDTVGINPKNFVQPGVRATENTKIRERIHLDRPDTLTIETTITDPAIFTTPFTFKQPYKLEAGWEMREYVCDENNKDHADPFGRPSMDLN